MMKIDNVELFIHKYGFFHKRGVIELYIRRSSNGGETIGTWYIATTPQRAARLLQFALGYAARLKAENE